MQALTAQQLQALTQAQQLLGAGRAEAAKVVAERLVREAPAAPDARQLLAMCQVQSGDPAGAEASFRKALKLSSDHPLILTNFGQMLRRAGRAEEALPVLEKATRRSAGFAPAWLALGRAANAAGRPDQAVQALEKLLTLKPESAEGWFELGQARKALELYESAHEALAQAVDLAPAQPVYDFALGVCERLMGRPEQALKCYACAADKGLDDPELTNARIGALLDQGQGPQAMELAWTLVRQHPEFTPGYETLADLLWEYGDAEAPDPEQVFREAMAGRRNDRELGLALAGFLIKARRHDRAIELIESMRGADQDLTLELLLAGALEACGRTTESARLYHALHAKVGDSSAKFLNAYTRHLLRAGEWKQAEKRALAATRIAPEDQEAWAYLATAWRLLGDPREEWLCDYDNIIAFLEVPPPGEYRDRRHHLEELKTVLDRLHRARREPIQQSLRGGSQTPGRLFGRAQPVIATTQRALTGTIESWLARLPGSDDHPFLKRNSGRIRYTGSWSVKLWSSGNHGNHIHHEGWISSAFYVALPPSVAEAPEGESDNAGCIQFGQPPDELELNLEPRRIIRPRTGHLALFPSYMWHGTVPFEDQQPRMTIAFDMRAAAQP